MDVQNVQMNLSMYPPLFKHGHGQFPIEKRQVPIFIWKPPFTGDFPAKCLTEWYHGWLRFWPWNGVSLDTWNISSWLDHTHGQAKRCICYILPSKVLLMPDTKYNQQKKTYNPPVVTKFVREATDRAQAKNAYSKLCLSPFTCHPLESETSVHVGHGVKQSTCGTYKKYKRLRVCKPGFLI
jgi:hypothetical protein